MKLIRCSETMNPCSVSVDYKWHDSFRNGGKSAEDDSMRCENDYEGHHFLTRLANTLTKNDVKKQQSSNFKEMTLGHYVSI